MLLLYQHLGDLFLMYYFEKEVLLSICIHFALRSTMRKYILDLQLHAHTHTLTYTHILLCLTPLFQDSKPNFAYYWLCSHFSTLFNLCNASQQSLS